MPRHRRRHVIARVERGAVEGLDQTDLVLRDHRRVEQPDVEQTGLNAGVFRRYRLCVYAIRTGRQYLDLRAFLAAVINKRFGVLKILVFLDRLTVKTPGIERRTV